jgi:hypothetical protein
LGRGLDRLGKSWSAVARRGQPLMISALRASALSAGFLGIQMRQGRQGSGLAQYVGAGYGRFWYGMATAADGSTGGFGSHCCSLWRTDLTGLGPIRQGGFRRGTARSGRARTADGSTEGSPSLLFSREQVWHGDASFGMASWGTVSWAMAGLLGLRLTPQALNFIY